MTLKELHNAARDPLKGFCRVCPVCNGKACAGEIPGSGGLGTGRSFINNFSALEAVTLNMRVIHSGTVPDISCNLLGLPLSMPIIPAPIGGVTLTVVPGGPEEDYGLHLARGCRTAGTVAGIGDGPMPILWPAAMRAMKDVHGQAIVFIKPWENSLLCQKLDEVADTGATVVGTDIDAPGLANIRKANHGITPKTTAQLAEVIEHSHRRNMKIILKGVMTVEDAQNALRAGADGIVVSNHGGRVLDHTPGTAEVLPEISAAVKGKMSILVDGGIRSGVDVLKMMALGADAVLIGRPFMIAVMGDQADGVALTLNWLADDLQKALMLTGCASLTEIGQHIVRVPTAFRS